MSALVQNPSTIIRRVKEAAEEIATTTTEAITSVTELTSQEEKETTVIKEEAEEDDENILTKVSDLFEAIVAVEKLEVTDEDDASEHSVVWDDDINIFSFGIDSILADEFVTGTEGTSYTTSGIESPTDFSLASADTLSVESSKWSITSKGILSGTTLSGASDESLITVDGTTIVASEILVLNNGIALDELIDKGTLTASSVAIGGGTINGSTIGAKSAAAGTFTTLTADSLQAGDVTLTLSTGLLDADALALFVGEDNASTTTQSASGLETSSDGLTLLQGCADDQMLSWDEATDTWQCSTVDSSVALGELVDSGTLIASTVDINGGNIDGTAIGTSSAAAGTFTTLTATGAVTLGNVSNTELNLLDSGVTLGELTDSGTLTAGTVDINSGAIDGATIGGTSAAAGTFTTLTTTGTTTLGNNSAAIAIDASEFDVSSTTGAITINDGGDAGAISVEGTNLDINDLTFAAAGTVASGGSGDLTLDSASNTLTVASSDTTFTASGITDLDCSDCIDFDDISDSTTIDAPTIVIRQSSVNDDALTLRFTNNGGTAGIDQMVVISNAVSTTTTGDLVTEALLLLNQADSTTTGNNAVGDGLLITNSGGSTFTDAIQIGIGSQSITNAINIASTGVTTDLILQNGETIDNNIDGEVNVNGNLRVDLTTISATQFAVCHTNSDTTDEDIGDCSGAPTADYAEQYPVAKGISYGDIVVPGTRKITTLDGDRIIELVKSNRPYEEPVVGIVSNNYGDFTSAGYNIAEEDNPMPIALVGRVPVNVTNDGGKIRPGDFLTTSSTSGYAMKASGAGRVIGMALSSFDKEKGQVMVQVLNTWWDGQTDAEAVFEKEQSKEIAVKQKTASSKSKEELPIKVVVERDVEFKGNIVVAGTAEFTGRVVMQDSLQVAGNITTEGALIQTFNGNVSVGDAVAITGENRVSRASAKNAQPAIGIVAAVNGDGTVEVAISGTIKGIGGLNTGAVYYLSEQAGQLTMHKPETVGAMVQAIGVARSSNALLVMPSLNVNFVEEETEEEEETTISEESTVASSETTQDDDEVKKKESPKKETENKKKNKNTTLKKSMQRNK